MEQEKQITQENLDVGEKLSSALAELMSRSVNDSISGLPEKLMQLDHELHKVQIRQQQFAYNFEAIKQSLEKLSANNTLLENASRANQCLTNEHYSQHIIEPMACSLFAIIDLIEDAQSSSPYQSGNELGDAIKTQLLQFLTGYGIEVIRHKEGCEFDRKLMNPVNTVSTQDKNLDGRVAKSLLSGFRWKDQKLLRAESVSLYKFENVNVNLIQEGGVL